jgi:hypothetical protein
LRFFTLLLLLVYSNLSWALGLGDIDLKSHLGEKLFAKVIVTDIDAQSESSCFVASDNSDIPAFKKANVTLQPSNSGYQLSITTNEIVTEPIVNLRISFQCEPNINREYVLLLDPAPLPVIENAAIENAVNAKPASVASDKKKVRQSSRKKSQTLDTANQSANEIAPDKPVLKKVTKQKKRKPATSVDEKLNEAYTGKQAAGVMPESNPRLENGSPPAVANSQSSSDKPFLVISGGSANANEGTAKLGLALRLTTEIDFTRPEPIITSPNTMDAMDEVTVMSNRLAHLEKQIASLQNRNTKLVADAAKAKEESEAFNWQKMLLIALGIMTTLAGFEWLRRKFFRRQSSNESAEWFDAESDAISTEEATAPPNINVETIRSNEPSFSEPNVNQSSGQSSSPDSIKTLAPFEIADHESVLDDANVFIAHGRPTLAIQLLQNHLTEAPAESPAIWFKLLNLLARESSETDYDEAVVECNKYFNIKAAKFGDVSEINNSSIEDYPHIVSRLEGVWGSQYAVGFLNDVIYNKRSQPREGLEQGAFDDLFFLKTIAKNLDASSPSTKQEGFHQSIPAKPDIENTSFNNALFTDIEPLDDINTSSNRNQNDVEFAPKITTFNGLSAQSNDAGTENSDFDDVTLDDVSLNVETTPDQGRSLYEANILLNSEVITHVDDSLETINFNLPHESYALDADEIDFSVPTEEIEITSTLKSLALSRESDKNIEHASQKNVLKNKSKTKTKENSSTKKQVDSNNIEWDLPEK